METKEKNYWMFRVRNRDHALKNSIVSYGWSGFDLSQNEEEHLQQIKDNHTARAASMARNFCKIQQGDIVLMPLWKNVVIGRIVSDAIHREDLKDKDEANIYEVEWLEKSYGRNNFSSALQGSLKYRGTFLNLWRYKKELEYLEENGFKDLNSIYNIFLEQEAKKEIERIAEHINSRKNISFQDKEFEKFIGSLFKITGFEVQPNNPQQEKKDGKDLSASFEIGLGKELLLNIQVKQHEGDDNAWAIEQISKSDNSDAYTENIVVTSARCDDNVKKKATEKDVILMDVDELAEIIYENFAEIDEKWKAKLNLYSSIRPVKK